MRDETRMSKKDRYGDVLSHLIDGFLKTGNEEELAEYLSSNSNLPGPRGNLELAYSFAEAIEDRTVRDSRKIWELATRLSRISASEAPVNDPKEFLSFCGAISIGAIGSVHKAFSKSAFGLLKKMADDSRWRMREGVAMGIQKLVAKQGQSALKELDGWIGENEWLSMRAVAAGVAEPALLKDGKTARIALELHKKIFDRVLAAKARKSDEFKTLRQALGYSLSVVACATPEAGFEFMRRIIDTKDADILWVVKENLKKNRLTRSFPSEVTEMERRLIQEPRH